MKKRNLLFSLGFAMLVLILPACSTTPQKDQSDLDQDLSAAASDSAAPSSQGLSETTESDLNGSPAVPAPAPDLKAPVQAAPTAPGDSSEAALDAPPSATAEAQNPPPPGVATEVPSLEPPAPEIPAPSVDVSNAPSSTAEIDKSGPAAKVTALDFKANVSGGTIVLKTNKPVEFTSRKNEKTNQFVIELKDTTVPKHFQRPYDTKEFNGPIASINAYQSNDTNSARIVIQLRQNVEPGVNQNGNVISIVGQGGEGANTLVSKNNDDQDNSSTNINNTVGDENLIVSENQTLQSNSVSDLILGTSSKFYGRPISLELKDADVRDVFAFISEESGLNIVVGEDVTGKVTLKLRKIPWDQALMVVMQSKQLGYVRQGRVLRIAPLKTLQAESDQAKTVIDAQRLLQPLHVQVFPISYAKSEDLELQSKDFLSPRGKARADKRTNNLVVTDIDENLVKIKALIKRLDTQTPQVLIEAKIIEARETYNRIVGVNWNFNGQPADTGLSNSTGQAINISPNFTTTSSVANPFLTAGFTLGTLDVFGDITASLNLLETEGLAKVLSAPRIVVLDRVEADIQQTTQYPVFSSTVVPTATAGGVSGLATTTSTVTFQDVRLDLKVTPQITVDGSVIMTLNVLREYADPVTTVGQSQARSVNKRQASTQVLVENGDTIVIGGIYQSDTTDSTTGIPWLSKIPLLGALFRTTNLTREKNELVIFLTPRILNRDKAFDKNDGSVGGVSPTGLPVTNSGSVPSPAPETTGDVTRGGEG